MNLPKEKRYLLYAMNNRSYHIDQEDMTKLEENANEMLVKLKQYTVHPASIVIIETYEVPYVQKYKTIASEKDPRSIVSVPDGDPIPPPGFPNLNGIITRQLLN